MASVAPDNPAGDPPGSRWPELFNRWLHDQAIRRTLLVAFLSTLVALVVLPLTGGPFALAYVFGHLSGGTGYAICRALRRRRDP
jgi:hypothetical protein